MEIDVDYRAHPGFAPFLRPLSDETWGTAFFAAADMAVAEALAAPRQGETTALERAQKAFEEQLAADQLVLPDLKPYVMASYQRAIARALDERDVRAAWGGSWRNVSAQARQNAEALLNEGFLTFNLPRDSLQALQASMAPDVEQLRRKAAAGQDDVIVTEPTNPDATRIVNEFGEHSGIFDLLSAYFNTELRQVGFVLHLSHPRDTWFRTFDDIGLEPPKTAQMHYDLDFCPPKAMLYLEDVDQDQGPFSLVRKSGPWEHFEFKHSLRKELVYGIAAYTREVHGKSAQGNISVFRFPEARRALGSLPEQLRGTGHPGDYIMDSSELSRRLLAAETRLIGSAGTALVFAGSHVLHRGGLVTKGERLALQIIFWPGNWRPQRRSLMSRVGRAARHYATRPHELIERVMKSRTN